ncbi:hypothetical protein DL98DRAFT_439446 [Cadophora sp. DSE1049]|nr:hypothetical protein DL98DRAFT_439446 [Cadophora sp. DSE1049]
MQVDIERVPPNGFPAIAHFIAQDDDAAIFRRFDSLGARNLLYLQSNLNELEAKLLVFDQDDVVAGEGNPDFRLSIRAYDTLKAAAERHRSHDGKAHERVELHKQIKDAMREYRDALIQEREVRAFKKPARLPLSIFEREFNREGNRLLGYDQKLLEERQDLLTLKTSEDDRLNRLLRYACYIMSVTFSGILLLGAMACLSLISNRSWKLRLGMVALFTSLFAVVVGLLTNARRAEIFGSTAAYAAVLVVFVSGNLGPGGGTRS